MLYFIYNSCLFCYLILLTKVMYSNLYLFLVICQRIFLTSVLFCFWVLKQFEGRCRELLKGRGMKRWSRERERWPVEPFCRDWKRQWALTSVGGFGLSSCLLVRPCGIKESKVNTLTHFPPFSSWCSFPLSSLSSRSLPLHSLLMRRVNCNVVFIYHL